MWISVGDVFKDAEQRKGQVNDCPQRIDTMEKHKHHKLEEMELLRGANQLECGRTRKQAHRSSQGDTH